MSTIENHSFENEINYNVKWFKAHNLALIGKDTLIWLFLPKTMLPTKYDRVVHFTIVRRRSLKNRWKMNDGFFLGFPEKSLIQDAPWI